VTRKRLDLDALLTETERLGVRLEARAGRLRVIAPAGVVTPSLRRALADRKPELLLVLGFRIRWRLEAMRRLAVEAPRPFAYARIGARGGPGWCFSCGDALDHPQGYGRCTPCDVASETFYSSQPDDAEAIA
jgi:hypothetical protein